MALVTSLTLAMFFLKCRAISEGILLFKLQQHVLDHLHREKDHGHCFLPTGALHKINEVHKADLDSMRDYARVRVWHMFELLH